MKPYAAMNPNGVDYFGTGAGRAHDLRGKDITIGMMLPLSGPFAGDGKLLLAAAQIALDEETKTPLPDGQQLTLAVGDESGPWGQASDQIVRLILQDQAVAVITSADGVIAHQAEQIANKIGVPVVTLSTDTTTTQINLPWIFRLAPSDRDEARAFVRDIYAKRRLHKVLLLGEADHDGRVGADEFERAARQFGAAVPSRWNVPPSPAGLRSALARVKALAPEVIVLWGDHDFAAQLVGRLRSAAPQAPIYLCRKAAEFTRAPEFAVRAAASPPDDARDGDLWMTASRDERAPAGREFAKDFLARTGREPSEAAASAYDAVRLVAAALRQTAPNRVRLREVLSSGIPVEGLTGAIAFDSAGNLREPITVVPLGGGHFRR